MRLLRLLVALVLFEFVVACSTHSQMDSTISPLSAGINPSQAQHHASHSGFGTFETFAIPGCTNNYCQPLGMSIGIDKRVWFANYIGGTIDSVNISGSFRVHNVDGAKNLNNYDVAEGLNRTTWFTAFGGGQGWVGHLAQGSVTLYPISFGSYFIARGFQDMWFAGGNNIAKISQTGRLKTFVLDPNSNVEVLVHGPDGNMWFTDEYFQGSLIQSRIGKITPMGKVTEFVVPDNPPGGIIGITVGPDNNLWFTDGSVTNGVTMIGRCTIDGSITLYPTPTTHANAWAIVKGPSNDLYFTETGVGQIGRITLNPVTITEYKVPSPATNPLGIALGADNNIWFTIPGEGLIGKFNTH